MWLKLDLSGIAFQLRIQQYEKSNPEDMFSKWCKVDLSFESKEGLSYHFEDEETLLPFEVEELQERIGELLKGNLEEPTVMECIEPDFEFHFFPKDDEEELDEYMELIIALWGEGGLSDNRLLLIFEKDNLEKLLAYLKEITMQES